MNIQKYNEFSQFKQLYVNPIDIYKKISLYEIAKKIYAVVIEDRYLRAMVFLRYQEFYESPSEDFQGKKFLFSNYMEWYKKNAKSDLFTYGKDWTGFNLPSDSIEKCLSDIDDINQYDHIMKSVINTIRKKENSNFYLLGIDSIDPNNMIQGLLDHELAHGFYYTNLVYKNNMISLINKSDKKEIIDKLSEDIINKGYAKSVLLDELQAYLSTGFSESMKNKGYELASPPFESYFQKFKSEQTINIIKINIDF